MWRTAIPRLQCLQGADRSANRMGGGDDGDALPVLVVWAAQVTNRFGSAVV